jgi:alpha 1,2-mannosyltransferase
LYSRSSRPHATFPDTPQIGLHFLLSVSNETYGNATSFDTIKSKVGAGSSVVKTEPLSDHLVVDDHSRRASAAFVILARNSDLKGIITSVKQMEDRFNKKYNYPYVFLNEKPFDDKFIECVRPVSSEGEC